MKISVITPSYNQAQFIQQTLNSIKEQKNVELEHIIIDPGSTDGSLDIIENYYMKNRNVSTIIGKDNSQTNAINIGFKASNGDILCWLNSDDCYVDDLVLSDVINVFKKDESIDVVYGKGQYVDPDGKKLKDVYINTQSLELHNSFITSVGILQPALFLRRSAFINTGLLNESFDFAFDYEYWVRLLQNGCQFHFLDRIIANAVIHSGAKTMKERNKSLAETIHVCSSHFGFKPYEWIERKVDCEKNNADGIFSRTKNDSVVGRIATERFYELNENSFDSILSLSLRPKCHKSLSLVKEKLNTSLWIVTSFDDSYFDSGFTLISGLCARGYGTVPKLIFDLGLTSDQKAILSSVSNTFVVSFDKNIQFFPESYFYSKSYVYKIFAMKHAIHLASNDDVVLWIDAGVYPLHDLEYIISSVKEDGCFFVDHDDKSPWPFFNMTFTSDECCRALNANTKELLSPHVCSCLMGCLKGHVSEGLFHEAFLFSLNEETYIGEKFPSPPIKQSRSSNYIQKQAEIVSSQDQNIPFDQLRNIFGYLGHRQDQSIISILVSRYDLPISSAKKFCAASDLSSQVSKLNWDCKGFTSEITPVVNGYSLFPDSETIHHRGTIISFEGAQFNISQQKIAVVLGNGPSLRNFDFSKLDGMDTFGMNAAYRFWYQKNWFPKFYCCLDLVVGVSHKDEIAKLINNASSLGIKAFLLRDNLIKSLGRLSNSSIVFNFDLLRKGLPLFQIEPITTGSHTCAWASFLGYKTICLLGIDCNYTEILPNAKKCEGNVLEIISNAKNPNYFFDGYQLPGDKYNIPNPSKGLHVRSWQNIAAKIKKHSTVYNANPVSKVDAFPFINFKQIHTK